MNWFDKAIMFVSPRTALNRVRVKKLIDDINDRDYEGAANGRRHSGWYGKGGSSVNTLLGRNLPALVARSRQLITNDGNASAAPGKIANNVVGTGIIATASVKKAFKDGKEVKVTQADKYLQAFKHYWDEWSDSIKCDYNEKLTFYGLQSLAIKTLVTSGEVLAIKKNVPSDVNILGIQILILEADYIDRSKTETREGGFTVNGVLYDSKGKRTGYWIFDKHPDDGGSKSTFIPVNDIIHLHDLDRPGQNRGVPFASTTLLQQRDLNDYKDAELLAKKTQACLTGFITNTSPEESTDPNDPIENMEPGAIRYLNQGESISFTSPTPSPGFSDFVKVNHRDIASGFKMTYENYTGDYSNVNFSSGRMGWIEFSRQVAYWQYIIFIPQFCNPIFEWFNERYKLLFTSTLKNVDFKAAWTAPRREMIDPVKETNAKLAALGGSLNSWREIVKQDGYNPDDVMKEMKEDQEAFKSSGLQPVWNPVLSSKSEVKKDEEEPE